MSKPTNRPTAFVLYRTQTGHVMRAAVRRKHSNGDLTVEPFFWQHEGKDSGTFQGGHTLRVGWQYLLQGALA